MPELNDVVLDRVGMQKCSKLIGSKLDPTSVLDSDHDAVRRHCISSIEHHPESVARAVN